MRRYQADKYGLISSYDIVEALRLSEARRRESERLRREREQRRLTWLAWLRRPALRESRSAA
jgi:hypothetical protein